MTKRVRTHAHTDGVVSTGEIVGGIFFAGDQLFGVEELTIGARANFVDDRRFQIEEDTSRHMFSSARFGEECIESVVSSADRLVRRHLDNTPVMTTPRSSTLDRASQRRHYLSIRLDAMFKAVKLPTGIADLDTGLADVNRNDFAHDDVRCGGGIGG